VSKQKAEIVITGRTKFFLSLCGEHLSVDNMNKAVELSAREMHLDVREFTVAGINHDPLFAHHWYIGAVGNVDGDQLRDRIDAHLKALNDDYAIERQHALKNVFLTVLPAQTFYDWMAVRGKMGGQHKFPRVLKKNQVVEWQAFVGEK
ncbi:MAG TPA: GH3 auxin-responsive promoter family protein, partial [Fibrella sp.]